MLSELTELKLQAAALKLELAQRTGQGPQPGEVSLAVYAAEAGLCENTVRKVERQALSRFAAGLLQQPDVPPYIARRIVSSLLKP